MSKRQHESPCLGISYYDPRENFNLNFSSCKLSETILEVQYLGLVFPFLLLSFLHLLIYSTNVYWPLLCDRDCVRGGGSEPNQTPMLSPRGSQSCGVKGTIFRDSVISPYQDCAHC